VILRQLQELIGGIYDVPLAHDVYDFLVTDRGRLPAAVRAGASDEQLIVAADADADAVGVSLYLDPGLLARLTAADPMRALHEGNVQDYCTALEGVSHFVYFAWNTGHDKAVSLHELELQAEIDKYVTSYWLLRRQLPARFPAELRRLYRSASRYAEKFCRHLERSLSAPGRDSEQQVLAELRRFYRLSDARKLAHIERHD